jgi:dTDP-4-dehydrorhamnose reductase
MKILLLGNTGQLGWELERTVASLGEVTAVDYPIFNLMAPDACRSLIRAVAPQIILNATAYTAVDKAENEPDTSLAYAINAAGPGLLAEEAKALHAALIHYSTDYVFDGAKGGLYLETDSTNPLGVYGASKLAGELAVAAAGCTYLTLRTTWVYSMRRDSFVTKVLQWSRQQTTLKVVSDQISGPTSARMLAEITAQLLAMGCVASLNAGGAHFGDTFRDWISEHQGVYHLAGDGCASRLEWAQEILKLDPHPEEQTVREVIPALTADFPTPAQRPLFSGLDCSKFITTFGLKLPPWQKALKLTMA